jgi:hypothetical protein
MARFARFLEMLAGVEETLGVPGVGRVQCGYCCIVQAIDER